MSMHSIDTLKLLIFRKLAKMAALFCPSQSEPKIADSQKLVDPD